MIRSTKIKICGLRRPEDTAAVNEYPPDYVGFVFAPSRRQVDRRTAAELRRELRKEIQAVGVFVNQPAEFIVDLCHRKIIDIVQLHGDESSAYAQELQKAVGVPIIRSVAVGKSLPPLPAVGDYLLFDAASLARGGTGKTFDWNLLKGYEKPYFLAGGLDYNNVKHAIRTLHPYAVDVSSGVETGGYKDRAKIRDFVRLVRGIQV